VLVPYNTANVERLLINFTNPDPTLGDERGQISQPHPFLTELPVRQALALAIDRQTISEQLYGPTGFPTCTLLWYPPFANSIEEFFDDCDQDLDEANRILDEAGWLMGPDGIRYRDGVALRPHFLNPPGGHAANAEGVQEQLRLVGTDTRFEVAEGGTYGPRWREGDYELSMTAQGGTNWGSFIGGSVHPDDFWTVNQVRFSDDPELLAVADQLREIIAEVRSTVDLEARREAWARGQQLFQDNALTYWLWHMPTILVTQPALKNFEFYTQTLFLHDAYLER
jgi:ABC-type transport system substrate-binding protein